MCLLWGIVQGLVVTCSATLFWQFAKMCNFKQVVCHWNLGEPCYWVTHLKNMEATTLQLIVSVEYIGLFLKKEPLNSFALNSYWWQWMDWENCIIIYNKHQSDWNPPKKTKVKDPSSWRPLWRKCLQKLKLTIYGSPSEPQPHSLPISPGVIKVSWTTHSFIWLPKKAVSN